MKVEFEDASYIQIEKDKDPSKAIVTVCAADQSNNITLITLDIEIEKLKEMINKL